MSSFLSGRPSTCPTVRRRRLTLVSVLLVPLVVMAGLSGLAPRAQAVYASTEGGAGSYPQEIDWMNWDTSQFTAGSTTTQWSTPTRIEGSDMWRAIRCTLAVDATAGLFSYTPGSWRADGLARLCNDGTNYTDGRENRPRPAANQQTVTGSGLQIGLASRYRQTPSFHVSCTSYVLQDPGGQWTRPTQADLDAATKTEIPSAGMVVADAVTCTLALTAVPATVTWSKADDEGNAVAGADGSPVVLTGDRPTALDAERVVKGDVGAFVNTPQAGTHTGRAVAIEVTDCAVGAGGVCAPDSRDQDPVAGSFRVPGMALGSYTLTETTAPTGYDRLGEPVVAQITAADQVTDYGALANARTAEPTGGASASSSPAVGASASGGALASGGPAVSAGATAGRPSASARPRPGLAATGVAAPAMLLGGLGAALLGGAAELARRRMNRR